MTDNLISLINEKYYNKLNEWQMMLLETLEELDVFIYSVHIYHEEGVNFSHSIHEYNYSPNSNRECQENTSGIKWINYIFHIADTSFNVTESTIDVHDSYGKSVVNKSNIDVEEVIFNIKSIISSYEIKKDPYNFHLIQKKDRFSSTKSARKTLN